MLGLIVAARAEVRQFSDRDIALVENFAAQAVIAIENARLINETREALEQQTATAEVLGVINASPGDLAPVFDAILEKAMTLCGAAFGLANSFDGERFHLAGENGVPSAFAEWRKHNRPVFGPGTGPARILAGENVVHTIDLMESEAYRNGDPNLRVLVELGGARTHLIVALRKDDTLLGTLSIYRQEVHPFTDKQIALLQNFAAQAVIAMENARLITETREALEQQTATAEVLGVINSSPGDLTPVFEAILEKAHTLCGADHGTLTVFDGESCRAIAMRGIPEGFAEVLRQPFQPGGLTEKLSSGAAFVHIADLTEAQYSSDNPLHRAAIGAGGVRTLLAVPLRRENDVLLGYVTANRREVRPFTDKQIALLQSFAAQAVIAIENARLITETHEALEQQTATAEVLGVINSSPGDLTPVFDAMLEKALNLCEAVFGVLWTYDGERVHVAASRGDFTFPEELIREGLPTGPGSRDAIGRLMRGEPIVHIADILGDPDSNSANPLRRLLLDMGGRTLLAAPLRKDTAFLGYFAIYRRDVRPFTDKQIALLQNFAAQAVIAMENARLLNELRDRTGDLEEALEYQTATSDVLKVISRSTFDLNPVLEYVIEIAIRLCRARMGSLFRLEDGVYRWRVGYGLDPAYREIEERTQITPGAGTLVGRVALEGRAVQIADALSDPDYAVKDEAQLTCARTMLGVPLLREGAPVGVIAMARDRVEPFSDSEVALVTTFADQAVIAIENARLLADIRTARDTAEATLRDLKAAQANLIQAEKMASLGQLTAGIAHEIKNPLNFVNNFASLSVELLEDLKETTAPAVAMLDAGLRAEADDTMGLLTGNLEKIGEHGRRADNIVKSMLEHSRGVSGERREVDLNNLIEEALNLAYHGARAQNQDFNITLERDYAKGLKPIELAPQEITRVFLNLFGNGFYAANKRAQANGDGAFHPVLAVATCEVEDAVEVRVRDNGMGIAPEIRDKLFQPFFTTKPTGEGTGLGLSISYDIVTQQHGGTITVESEPGTFTEFTVCLPRQ